MLRATGDTLTYEYDFGDGWSHLLRVEQVLAESPERTVCLDGRLACPPEDCGGVGGYADLAAWVRSDYAPALLPEGFDNAKWAREWLPEDWHPDHLDLDHTNAALALVTAEVLSLPPELAELAYDLESHGILTMRRLLQTAAFRGPTEVSDAEAARLTEPFRLLLEAVSGGVTLTAAGYLPPAVVRQLTEAWELPNLPGFGTREDSTPPIRSLRAVSRALGLVTVRKRVLAPTAIGRRALQDPQLLLTQLTSRLPLPTTRGSALQRKFERHAAWLALVVAASGKPLNEWHKEISGLLTALGWRVESDHFGWAPSPHSDTLWLLAALAGSEHLRAAARRDDPAVASLASAALLGEHE